MGEADVEIFCGTCMCRKRIRCTAVANMASGIDRAKNVACFAALLSMPDNSKSGGAVASRLVGLCCRAPYDARGRCGAVYIVRGSAEETLPSRNGKPTGRRREQELPRGWASVVMTVESLSEVFKSSRNVVMTVAGHVTIGDG